MKLKTRRLPNVRESVSSVSEVAVVVPLQVADGALLGLHFGRDRRRGDSGRRGTVAGSGAGDGACPLALPRVLYGERRRGRLHITSLLVTDARRDREGGGHGLVDVVRVRVLRVRLFGDVLQMRRGLTGSRLTVGGGRNGWR